MTRTLVLTLALPLVLAACVPAGAGDAGGAFVDGSGRTTLILTTIIEARTADERRAGLSAIPKLGAGEGLWIVFPVQGEVCITNAPISYAIDAIFMDGMGAVLAVAREMPAFGVGVECRPGTQSVLEVPAGRADAVAAGQYLAR